MRSTDRNDSDFDREVDDVLRQSQLATRLNRRGTAPIGVIDVRHPQYLYDRTAGWIAQRFPLLAYFMTRYGSDAAETSGYGGFVYTSASELSSDEPSSLGSLGNHTPQVFEKSLTPTSTLAEELSRQPADTFRVSRRRPPALAGTISSDPSFGLQTGEDLSRSRVAIHEAKDGAPVVLAKERQVTADLFVPSRSKLRQTSFQEIQQTSEVPEAKRSMEIVGSPPTPVQPIWQKANPVGLTGASDVKESQSPGETPGRPKVVNQPIGSQPFFADPNERREQFDARRGVSKAVRSVERQKQSGDSGNSAVAVEDRDGTSQLPGLNMIWRKNPNPPKEAGPEFRGLNQGLVSKMHQVFPIPEPSPSPIVQSPSLPQAPTVRRGGDLDIGEIAAKVSRVIVSQLIVERERRGVRGWR